jgi:glycerophosphoryl diester phosphodiesterase
MCLAAWLAFTCLSFACHKSENAPAPQTNEPPPATAAIAALPQPTMTMPKIKAHRGASARAPENTVIAVKLAFEVMADGAEIDVHVSKDGVPVVIHDEDTERVAGHKALVSEQTLAELKKLDVGSWKSPEFAGERIPTLEEVLALIPAGKTLFVEIKGGPSSVPIVLKSISDAKSAGTIAVESFSLDVLEAVGIAAPTLGRHWTIMAEEDPKNADRLLPHDVALVAQAKKLGFDGLSVDGRGLRNGFAEAARAAGLELAVWTIDHVAIARAMSTLPITWIETNEPEKIRSGLAQ